MKILLIEDEVKTANYLRKGLEEEGFAVDSASDGMSGLDLATKNDYDLLILDVMLPEMDGWSIIAKLRATGKKTLALFLTARDELDDRVKGLDLGGDAYMVKPFAFSELIAQIRSLLRRGPQREIETILKVADLTIDRMRHSATRAGARLDLTPKEFALLLLLVTRKGQIITRTTISEHVWNIHFDSGSNAVDVHIRRLRTKVDDPYQHKLIKTVRGMGYTIEE